MSESEAEGKKKKKKVDLVPEVPHSLVFSRCSAGIRTRVAGSGVSA